jgi:eukaryotic-like serine/threonine-protein kinase
MEQRPEPSSATTSGGPITLRETGPSRSGRGALLAGKYRLEMLLGEGGMGFVWSAYNRELERPVAIKLMRAGRNGQRFAERLRLEARAAARLAHPSIVRIYDVAVTEAGEPFLVMELLTGETLASALARGPLDGARAVQLILPIVDALALAHERGVVHRDLKPQNVFLCTEGDQCQPKLLDFGIAKLGDGGPRLTEDGMVLGSPHYMSPEQIAGEEVDASTDIWSLCVVLYRAVAGVTPFSGADKRAVMDSILRDAPAPIPDALRVDAGLRDVLRWGLGKDRLDRPQSMRELGQALARWLFGQGVEEDACGASLEQRWLLSCTRPTVPCGPPPRARRRRELVAAVALVVLGGSVAWTGSAQTSVKATPVVVAAPPAPRSPAPVEPPAVPLPPPALVREAEPTLLPASESTPPPSATAPRRARPARRAPQLPF